jgi:Na+/H+ antiporter NhaD/arsenite permease-like protein
MPILMREIWHTEVPLPPDLEPEPLQRPYLCFFALAILLLMVVLFITGEMLPARVVPPAVAIIAATLGLLLVYEAKVDHVTDVLKDVDWRTLLFLIALFCLVQAFANTGILQSMSQYVYTWFGTQLLLVSLFILAFVGLCSSFLANIPVVAIILLMLKGYLVTAQIVPETALAPNFTDWPPATLPVFVAMMFAGTLGGNATLIGASANIVAGGICAAQGQPISFGTFLRYGAPLMFCQLLTAGLYVLGLQYFLP